jgi:AcrR family transcriptional regulator
MHFPSKESVLQELWEDLWRDICALHTELASRCDWSHPVLNAWLSTVSGVWREHAHILALAMYSPMAGLYDTLGERLKTEAEKLAVAPHWMSFTPDEARRRSHLLLLQLHQAMAALHFRGWCVDAEALVESLTDIWLQAATGLPDVDFAQAS